MSIGEWHRSDKQNNDEVICPNCVHQFRAIPVNVQSDLARLTEENEALRKDAERFRFLKRVYFDIKMSAFQLIGPTSTPEELDATIDAAIKEEL